MDNKEKVGSPDRDRINIHENYEVEYWAKKFGVSPERLREAVEKVGTTATKVEEYFKNK